MRTMGAYYSHSLLYTIAYAPSPLLTNVSCKAILSFACKSLSRLIHDLDQLIFMLGLSVQHAPAGTAMLAPEKQIERTGAHTQTLDFNGWQPLWQRRSDVETPMRSIRAQPQNSTQHMKNRPRRPALRDICAAGIKHRKIKRSTPRGTGKHFGRTKGLKVLNCIKYSASHSIHLIYKAITFKPLGDNPIILRPDRTSLVCERIIGRILR